MSASAEASARLLTAVERLSDRDRGLLYQVVRDWRASLPAHQVVLVDVLDLFRELPVAVLATSAGVTVAEIKAEISAQLAEGGDRG